MIKPNSPAKTWLSSLQAGAAAGAAASLPVLAINYFSFRTGGLTFLPYLYFDWLVRVLPGWIVVPGLKRMLALVGRLTPGAVDTAAKTVENGLAWALFIFLSAFSGVLVAILGRRFRGAAGLQGPLWGGLLFGLSLAIEMATPPARNFTIAGIVLQVLLFLGWGSLLGLLVSLLEGRWMVNPSPEKTVPDVNYARRRLLAGLVGGTFGVFMAWTGLDAALRRPAPVVRALTPTLPPTRQPSATLAPIQTETLLSQAPIQAMAVPEITLQATSTPVPTIVIPDSEVEPDSAAARSPEGLGPDRRILPAPGTRQELTDQAHFYRVDIDIDPPAADPSTWRLVLDGLVSAPLTLSLAEIRARPAVHQIATFSCISNTLGGKLISNASWTGIRVKDLLTEAGLKTGAAALRIEALDGYYESSLLSEFMDERSLLLYEMNGEPLSPEYGFPLRIFIPGHYGMKQPKWISHLMVIDKLGGGFWSDRGWSQSARVHGMSSIDTVDQNLIDPVSKTVPVGGIAYAGDRGILRVEVQVDEGAWLPAKLRNPPLSGLSWVQWRLNTPYQPGHHTFRVRATDGTGQVQNSVIGSTFPDGATGEDWKDVDFK